MSKFYTYKALKRHFPTKEAVTEARDRVNECIKIHNLESRVVIYGSSVWGTHSRFDDQHTRRSDVDVAISSEAERSGFPDQGDSIPLDEKGFMFFCDSVAKKTRVPVEVIKTGESNWYRALINPSTQDHFRLLASRFPRSSYGAFKSSMKVHFKERLEDLCEYIQKMHNAFGKLRDNTVWEHEWNMGDPAELWQQLEGIKKEENFTLLSKFENFPDHLIRKVLGREKFLPCPDSKQNIRDVFRDFPFAWVFRDTLLPIFEEVWACSQEYEALIDDVNAGLSEKSYYEQLAGIAGRIIKATEHIFEGISRGKDGWGCVRGWKIPDILAITRIPKGTPVIILTHHRGGSGWVSAETLIDDFGNPKTGVSYTHDFATKAIYGTKPDDPLIVGWERIPQTLHYRERNLQWIKDPLDPEKGWFWYKMPGGELCSIRPCSEEFLQRFKRETDEEIVGDDAEMENRQRYYTEFSKTALDPSLSPVTKYNKRKKKEKVLL